MPRCSSTRIDVSTGPHNRADASSTRELIANVYQLLIYVRLGVAPAAETYRSRPGEDSTCDSDDDGPSTSDPKGRKIYVVSAAAAAAARATIDAASGHPVAGPLLSSLRQTAFASDASLPPPPTIELNEDGEPTAFGAPEDLWLKEDVMVRTLWRTATAPLSTTSVGTTLGPPVPTLRLQIPARIPPAGCAPRRWLLAPQAQEGGSLRQGAPPLCPSVSHWANARSHPPAVAALRDRSLLSTPSAFSTHEGNISPRMTCCCCAPAGPCALRAPDHCPEPQGPRRREGGSHSRIARSRRGPRAGGPRRGRPRAHCERRFRRLSRGGRDVV